MIVTRFAPSPTGYLHLGHAYSARCGFLAARQDNGQFLVRIEDIDATRCRSEFESALLDDLRFLGLDWDGPVRRQSEHMAVYEEHLAGLQASGLLYPCFCTRAEIAAEIAQAGGAPHDLPGPIEMAAIGLRYPGTCRRLSADEAAARMATEKGYALRLDVERAIARLRADGNWPLFFEDRRHGRVRARPDLWGDVVLGRKEVRTSYHVAVTIDDHLQGVTLVTRGIDLFQATHIHRLLQALFQFAPPLYDHHSLLNAPDGSRLAKRRGSPTLRSLRQAGHSAADIFAMIDAAKETHPQA